MSLRRKPVSVARKGESLRIHGSIARELGVRIVSGRYKPGDVLDNEIHASKKLKVSRTAYREAVRILGAKGLVHSRPRVGTRVSIPEEWQLLDPDVLSWIFERDPADKLIENLFELRKMVEPEAAALAASRRTPTDLVAMEHALQGMERHTLTNEDGRLADRQFHTVLLRASDNAFLISLTSSIAAAITWTAVFKYRDNPSPRNPIPDHRRVYDAIAAANPKAARKAMSTLIDLALLDTQQSRQRKPRAR
jgi:DNA-binding FadR family transcriptional regulator